MDDAITMKVKKVGMTQAKNGDWQLRLTVASADLDPRVASAALGTGFTCTMVEAATDNYTGQRDKWGNLGPAQQCALRCKDPIFRAFLREELQTPVESEEDAVMEVRAFLGVESRSELSHPGRAEARTRWYRLDDEFQAWKVRDSVT